MANNYEEYTVEHDVFDEIMDILIQEDMPDDAYTSCLANAIVRRLEYRKLLLPNELARQRILAAVQDEHF